MSVCVNPCGVSVVCAPPALLAVSPAGFPGRSKGSPSWCRAPGPGCGLPGRAVSPALGPARGCGFSLHRACARPAGLDGTFSSYSAIFSRPNMTSVDFTLLQEVVNDYINCVHTVWFGIFEYKNLVCLNHVLQFWRHFYWGLDSTDKVVVPRSICLLVKEMLTPYHKLDCFTFAVWENPFWPLVWVTTSLYLVNIYTCVFKTGL